jgi:urease gamma subunit
MGSLPYWFIGMAVVFCMGLLSVAVGLNQLRRKPPIEVDISSAVESLRKEFTGKMESESRTLHGRVSGLRDNIGEAISCLRQEIREDRDATNSRIDTVQNSIIAHSRDVMTAVAEMRGEIKQMGRRST